MRSGQIDAISNLDPVITLLQRSGDLKIVSDTRVVAEADKVFGGPMPAGCLYAPQTFIDKNPNTVQALTNAIVRADKWIQAAGPGDIIKAVPESYLLGDRAVYIDAFLAAKGALSPDGMIPEAGPDTAFRALASIDAGDRRRQARPPGGLHQRLRQEGQREVSEGLSKPPDAPLGRRRRRRRVGHASRRRPLSPDRSPAEARQARGAAHALAVSIARRPLHHAQLVDRLRPVDEPISAGSRCSLLAAAAPTRRLAPQCASTRRHEPRGHAAAARTRTTTTS